MKKREVVLALFLTAVLVLLNGCTNPAGLSPGHNRPIPDEELHVDIEIVENESGGNLSSCHFIQDEDGVCLMLTPNMAVQSFKFVALTVEEDNRELKYSIADELYSVEEISPEKPFAVKMQFVGLLPTYGIVFEDQNGNERFYTINMKGTDPSESFPYYLSEADL